MTEMMSEMINDPKDSLNNEPQPSIPIRRRRAVPDASVREMEAASRASITGENEPVKMPMPVARGDASRPVESSKHQLDKPDASISKVKTSATGRFALSEQKTGNTPPRQPASARDGKIGEKPATAGRKALRGVLMLLVAFVLAGIIYFSIEDQRRPTLSQLSWQRPPPITLDDQKGKDKAMELAATIASGFSADVVGQAEMLRREFPQDILILGEVYRAEAVSQVEEIAKLIDGLPEPDPRNPLLTETENVRRLASRLKALERIRQLREDWGASLAAAPGVRGAFERLAALLESGEELHKRWELALAALEDAKEALTAQGRQPDYERAIRRLRVAQPNYPSPTLPPIANAVADLARAERSLEKQDVSETRKALAAIQPGEEPPAIEGGTALMTEIREWILLRAVAMKDRLDAANRFAAVPEAVDALHLEGDTGAALERIAEAFKEYPAADPLFAGTRRDLETRRKHWTTVLNRYESIIENEAGKSFRERSASWVAFQRILREGDDYYSAVTRERLASVEREVLADIDESYARLTAAAQRHTGITTDMRNPDLPRESFAREAAALGEMSTEANHLLAMRPLAEALPSAEKYKPIFAFALNVTDTHSRESQRMWNMAETYRRHNQPIRQRECLERILLYGEAPSNRRLTEAREALVRLGEAGTGH